MQQYYLIGDIYAKALLESSADNHDELSAQLHTLAEAFSAPDSNALIRDPAVSDSQKIQAISAIIDQQKFLPVLKGFFATVIDKKRMDALPAIAVKVADRVRAAQGKISVTIETAAALKAAEKKKVVSALETSLGKKIEPDMRVVPALLGGMRIYAGSVLYDYSINTRLKNLALYCKKQHATYTEPK